MGNKKHRIYAVCGVLQTPMLEIKREVNMRKSKCNRSSGIGGQAVLEGVMMKSGERVCIAVRKPDGSIEKQTDSFVSVRKKHKFLNIPIFS